MTSTRNPSTPRSSQKRSTSYIGIAPVQIRLLWQEAMQVVLAGSRLARPGRSAELRQPIVGRRSVGLAVAPDVPVAHRIGARRAAFEKPRMMFRGVIGNEIENDIAFSCVGRMKKPVEIIHRSEQMIDVAVVADVVPEIRHR